MLTTEKDIIAAALTLPPTSRATIVERLLDSFGEAERKEIDVLWAEEAEDRIRAYERGEITSIPGEQVFRKLLNKGN